LDRRECGSGGWVNALAIDPQAPRTVYAGTNDGVSRARTEAANGERLARV